MNIIRFININIFHLFVINGFVLAGILPFYIFVLGTIPTILKGVSFQECIITEIEFRNNKNSGKYNNTCYLIIQAISTNGRTYTFSELCNDFKYDPITERFTDIGKPVYARIDHGSELEIPFITRHQKGNGFFNSIIKLDNKPLNNKYLPNNMTWSVFFIWGMSCFIRWVQVSLVPRLKGTHYLQITFKNQK